MYECSLWTTHIDSNGINNPKRANNLSTRITNCVPCEHEHLSATCEMILGPCIPSFSPLTPRNP